MTDHARKTLYCYAGNYMVHQEVIHLEQTSFAAHRARKKTGYFNKSLKGSIYAGSSVKFTIRQMAFSLEKSS